MLFSTPSVVNAIISLLLCVALSSPIHPRARLCNGSTDLCTTRYSAMTSVIGAHNSPFVGPLPQQNQNRPPAAQLDLGARMLQAQTRRSPKNSNTVQLCHTNCLLEDGGLLKDWLTEIKTWMEDPGHEDEVVTLLLTNPDGVALELFHGAFRESGVESLCFTPDKGQAVPLKLDSWPTLSDMIGPGNRLVVFMDSGADPQALPYVLDEFSYFFETPFGVTDAEFTSCSIDRPLGGVADGRMYIVNHFLDVEIAPGVLVPDRLRATETNSKRSIGAQTKSCQDLHGGKAPNFVLLNFVDQGDWHEPERPEGGFAQEASSTICGFLGGIGIDC